jgi:hypothetical protein
MIDSLKIGIDFAIISAEKAESSLNDIMMSIGKNPNRVPFATHWAGMSSPKGRHFFNNVCRQVGFVQKVRYLEIGTWAGSTLISFIYKQPNLEYVSAIDNFSQFQTDFDVKQVLVGGLAHIFRESLSTKSDEDAKFHKLSEDIQSDSDIGYEINFSLKNCKFQFLESHCFDLDKSRLFGKYNVYFYDGPHSYENTKKSFEYYNDVFDNIFIVIIDDWNRDYIQNAWRDVSKELNYIIHYEREIFGRGGSETNPDWRNDWWDGYYIAIIEKE